MPLVGEDICRQHAPCFAAKEWVLRRKVGAQRETLRQRNVGAEISPGLECDLKLALFEIERREHQPGREYQKSGEPQSVPFTRTRRSINQSLLGPILGSYRKTPRQVCARRSQREEN